MRIAKYFNILCIVLIIIIYKDGNCIIRCDELNIDYSNTMNLIYCFDEISFRVKYNKFIINFKNCKSIIYLFLQLLD